MIDRFAEEGLGRLFGEMPGKERLAQYLQRRARRELAKLTPDQLGQYLQLLQGLMAAIHSGENFEAYATASMSPPEEPAA